MIVLLSLFLLGCNKQPDGMTANDQPIYLKNYQHKWVVINYWAPWCKPCITELPALNRFFQKHQNNVEVLAVSFDQLPNNEILDFAKKYQLSFPMLSKLSLTKYGIKDIASLPMTIIISPADKLVDILHGPQTEADLEKILEL